MAPVINFHTLAKRYDKGLVVLDRQHGRVVSCNPRALSMLQKGELDTDWMSLVVEDPGLGISYQPESNDKNAFPKFFKSFEGETGGRIVTYEAPKSGRKPSPGIQLHTRLFSVKHGSYDLICVVLATPTKAQFALHSASIKLKAAKSSASMLRQNSSHVVYDITTRVILGSQKAADALLGLPAGGLVGRTLLSICESGLSDSIFNETSAKYHEDSGMHYFEVNAVKSDGTVFPMRAWLRAEIPGMIPRCRVLYLENTEDQDFLSSMIKQIKPFYKTILEGHGLEGYIRCSDEGVILASSRSALEILKPGAPPNSVLVGESIHSLLEGLDLVSMPCGRFARIGSKDADVDVQSFRLDAIGIPELRDQGLETVEIFVRDVWVGSGDAQAHTEVLDEFGSLARAMDEVIIVCLPDMSISVVGGAIGELLGFDASEIEGENVNVLMSRYHRENHDKYVDEYRRSGIRKRIGHPASAPLSCIHKSGKTVDLLVEVKSFMMDGVEMFYGTLRSVASGRDAAISQLHYANEAFSNVISNSPSAYVVTDGNMKIIETNEHFSQMVSITSPEMLSGKEITDLFDIHDAVKGIKNNIVNRIPFPNKKIATLACSARRVQGTRFTAQVEVLLLTDLKASKDPESIESLLGRVRFLCNVKNLETEFESRQEYEESCTRLSALINSVDDTILVADISGTIQECNTCACRTFSYERSELIGMEVEDLLPMEFREKHKKARTSFRMLRRKTTMGSPITTEILLKSGNRMNVDVILNEMVVSENEVMLVALVRDVSIRVAFQDAMKTKEASLRNQINGSSSPVIVVDSRGQITIFNPAACSLFKYEEKDIIGKNVDILMGGEDKQNHMTYMENYLRTGDKRVVDSMRIFNGYASDGEKLTLEVRVSESLIAGVHLFTAVLNDISERMRNEEAISKSEEQMKVLVEHAFDGIIVSDKTGIIHTFNPSAQIMFGISEEEAIGSNVSILMPSPYCEEHDSYIQAYLKTSRKNVLGYPTNLRGRSKNGATFDLEMNLSEITVGSSVLFTAVVRNVSEQVAESAQWLEMSSIVSKQINWVEEGVMIVNNKMKMCVVNNALKSMVENEKLKNKPLTDLMVLGDNDRCKAAFTAFMKEIGEISGSRQLKDRVAQSKIIGGQPHAVILKTKAGAKVKASMRVYPSLEGLHELVGIFKLIPIPAKQQADPSVGSEPANSTTKTASPRLRSPQLPSLNIEEDPSDQASLIVMRPDVNSHTKKKKSPSMISQASAELAPPMKATNVGRRSASYTGRETKKGHHMPPLQAPNRQVHDLISPMRRTSTAALSAGSPRVALKTKQIPSHSAWETATTSSSNGDTTSSGSVSLQAYMEDTLPLGPRKTEVLLEKFSNDPKKAQKDEHIAQAAIGAWAVGDIKAKIASLPWSMKRVCNALEDKIEESRKKGARLEPAKLIREMLKLVLKMMGWEVANVFEWNALQQTLSTTALYVSSDDRRYRVFEEKTHGIEFRLGVGIPGLVFKSKEPMCVVNMSLESDEIYPRAATAREAGLKGSMGLPLPMGPEVNGERNMIGVVEFFSSAEQTADRSLLRMLEVVTDLIGQVFMDARTTLG